MLFRSGVAKKAEDKGLEEEPPDVRLGDEAENHHEEQEANQRIPGIGGNQLKEDATLTFAVDSRCHLFRLAGTACICFTADFFHADTMVVYQM